MDAARMKCSECGGRTSEGTVADVRRGSVEPGEWVAGRAESGTWTSKLKNEIRFEITAFRCDDCGYLRFYALRPATSSRAAY